jgi:hypothetical protein
MWLENSHPTYTPQMHRRIPSNTLKSGEKNQRKKMDDTLQETRMAMYSLWYLSARNFRAYPQLAVGQDLGNLVSIKIAGGCSSPPNNPNMFS